MKSKFLRLVKKSILRSFFISWALMIIGSIFLSCSSMPSRVIDKAFPRVDSKPPIDAFGLVSVNVTIKPKKCLKSENEAICKTVIKNLPPVSQGGIGSGLLVEARSKPIFLTAAHVCQTETPTTYNSDGISISLESFTEIKIRISTGAEVLAKIIKLDTKNDLCALSPEHIFTKPVQWSSRKPQVGDVVYAISAPHGINAPSMNLIFSGYYSGYIGPMSHYTIPTRPGSSGSVVLDKNYMGVGMLNAAYIRMESIGIGTDYDEIKEFLNSI